MELKERIWNQHLVNREIAKPKTPTYEADVKIDNVHYVLTIDRKTEEMLEYRAAQW